jgi:predicted HTH domain antitoxin
MVTAGNRETNLVAMVTDRKIALSVTSTSNTLATFYMFDNNYSERERLVIELYKNQNKSIREIAKTVKMSFRDIGFILKKEGLSHGITTREDNNDNKKSSNEATQAYKLFSEGKKPVQVAIELNLREGQGNKFFRG